MRRKSAVSQLAIRETRPWIYLAARGKKPRRRIGYRGLLSSSVLGLSALRSHLFGVFAL